MNPSPDSPKVLVVDDAEEVLELHRSILAEQYLVFTSSSGERALEIAPQLKPEVILLDVSMDGLDGYETCKKLKSNPETSDVDVIFISAADTVQEKLKGFEVGAVNYLTKPVESDILLSQLKKVIELREKRKQLEQNHQEATQVAMIAIASAGEQGIIIDFMRSCFSTKSSIDLANLIVDTSRVFELECSVQVRSTETVFNSSTSGVTSALEEELLTRLKHAGRIRQSGNNLVLNYGSVTILVKEMPDCDEKKGRLRDHLAMLAEAGDMQNKSIQTSSQLEKVVEESNWFLRDIQAMQKVQKDTSLNIFDGMMEDINNLIETEGLTETQEYRLVDITKGAIEKYLNNFEAGVKIDESFLSIVERLNAIVKLNQKNASQNKVTFF